MIPKLLAPLLISAAIYLLIAVALILTDRPKTLEPQAGLDFDGLMSQPPLQDPTDEISRDMITMSDGSQLMVSTVGADASKPLIVMVHGSGWHGGQFDRLALSLRDVAEIRSVTLRGHGERPDRRGDVDYIGQPEDDLAEIIGEQSRPVLLLGHSSGGGLAIRFAGGKHRDLIEGAILLSPFLKYNAPTMRDQSGGWTQALSRRLAGLSMLNMVGITALNHLTVIQFNMPRAVLEGPQGHMATLAYSFRLNTSYAPRNDYLADIGNLPPFLLVAGRDDEAFVATQFEPVMSGATDAGRYMLLDGVSHLDVVDAPETKAAIRDFLREF